MKKLWTTIIIICCLFVCWSSSSTFAADIVDSGTCGTNVTWTLDSDGLLTISGSGPMDNGQLFYGIEANVKNVIINSGVSSIGDSTFSSCTSLTSITIPDSVTSIGKQSFYRCSQLTNITIPDGVTSIGRSAFSFCYGLTDITVPDGVTSIEDQTFRDCNSLASITIPDSLISIGHSVFSGCSSLTSIIIPDRVLNIGDGAFSGCSSLTNIMIPDGVTSIGDSTFSGCNSLTSITIPDSVTSIGSQAFYDCSQLTNITIPAGVTSIASGAFSNCRSLTNITIPDGVTSIEHSVFSYCSKLTSITIPDGVTSIEDQAFDGCHKLVSITIPEGVTSIGTYTFRNCSSLISITIPESVASIGNQAFNGCSSLTNISIPDGVTIIGDWTFGNCDSLTSITIPDGVTSIGSYAFKDCNSLTSITIPGSVTNIGEYAFGGCLSIKDIYFNGTTAEWNELVSNSNIGLPDGVFIHTSDLIASGNCGADLTWVLNGDGLLTISGTGQMSSANTSPWSDYAASVLTAQINSGATSIGDSAFKDCSNLTSIAIPSSVTKIGRYSFWGCSNLKSITIPPTVTFIDTEAFDGLQEIYGNECSTAHRFAVQHNIAFEPVEGDTTSHTYEQTEWQWAEDYSSAQAVYTCSECHMEYEGNAVITQSGTAATCTASGTISYIAVAEFNGSSVSDAKSVTIPALGHDWGDATYIWAADNRTVTATRTCKHDASHLETETATVTSEETKPAGCETKGETTYTAVFTNEAFETQQKVVEDIAALDHDWSDVSYTWSTDNRTATATRKCLRNASHTETETVNTISSVTKEATCEERGEITYTANFKNSGFAKQTKTVENGDALGHTFKPEPVWVWNDDLTVAAARFYCSRCDAYEEAPGEIVDSGRTNPTHTEEGQIYASALAEYKGKDYYDYKKVTIPVEAHTYGTPFWEWADDGSSASLIAECTECGARIETEATVTQSGEKVEPTCSKPGQVKYLAYARYEGTRYSDTKTFTLTAEHDYGSWTYYNDSMHSRTCTNCGEVETESHSFVSGRCKCGFDSSSASLMCDTLSVNVAGFHSDDLIAAASYTVDGKLLEFRSAQVGQKETLDFEFNEIEKASKVSVFYLDQSYRPIHAFTEISHEVGTTHIYTETLTKAATCDSAGEKTFTCKVCGDSYSESIPKLEHIIVNDAGYAATCITPGRTEGSHCSVCGKIIKAQVEIPAMGHDFKNNVCTVCGAKYVAVSRVVLSQHNLKIEKDKEFMLEAQLQPYAATPQPITWSSNNSSVASVSADGLVTGKGVGTATITASSAGKSASCTVTVYAIVGSGECGANGGNLVWKLDSDGFLLINGYGEMKDYLYFSVSPWHSYSARDITKVMINNDVTSIGSAAFDCCWMLSDIYIPSSIKRINSYAFNECESLNSIVIPEGVQSIGYQAFRNCRGLESIVIPKSLTHFDEDVFVGCDKLKYIYYRGNAGQWNAIAGSDKVASGNYGQVVYNYSK